MCELFQVSTSMKDLCHDVFGVSKEKKDPKSVKGNRGKNSFTLTNNIHLLPFNDATFIIEWKQPELIYISLCRAVGCLTWEKTSWGWWLFVRWRQRCITSVYVISRFCIFKLACWNLYQTGLFILFFCIQHLYWIGSRPSSKHIHTHTSRPMTYT